MSRAGCAPEERGVAALFLPATNRIVYQPLGVVGIVSPWTYPVGLALIPLATALAAGNRAMLNPSELTPATTDLIAAMIAETFDEDQVAVVTVDAKVGAAFSSLPCCSPAAFRSASPSCARQARTSSPSRSSSAANPRPLSTAAFPWRPRRAASLMAS
jgi:acyl-CoA reductase-like NAD-dependent aldehyde dehydrogenase